MKVSTNKIKKAMIALGVAVALVAPGLSFARANNDNTAEIKFLGSQGSLPVFQLVVRNSSHDEYTITIRDSQKKILLIEKLKGEIISRKYKLDVEEPGWIAGTTFELVNNATKESTSYEIGSNLTIVKNVSEGKL